VPEAELAELAERNGVPARKIGQEWRFLRRALNDWLLFRSDPHAEGWLITQHWLLAPSFREELLVMLEERLLQKLQKTAPALPKPGSKQAVLKHFGVFRDDDDLDERLADARNRREAGG
jgi:hypothetical protein